MKVAVVEHPEVDEQLYVHECVVRVACPVCKVKAGVPCKGARFEWLARGERRGFRYVQGTHRPRTQLFQGWKTYGGPRRLPEALYERFSERWGAFPRGIDRRTPTLQPSVERRSAKRASRMPKRKTRPAGPFRRDPSTGFVTIEHRGCTWEGIEGNHLWSWHPYREQGDWRSISVYDFPDRVSLHFFGYSQEHLCESREAAFDLAIKLVIQASLLAAINGRIQWRIHELERRFGDQLKG